CAQAMAMRAASSAVSKPSAAWASAIAASKARACFTSAASPKMASISALPPLRSRINRDMVSTIEKHGFAGALQNDVEPIATSLFARDQRITPLRRHQFQDGIGLEPFAVREVDPGHQPFQHAARQNANRNMRRLQAVARTRHSARQDRTKA